MSDAKPVDGAPGTAGASAPATRSLHASEQLFRLLVDSVVEYSIYVIDERGIIATWNAGARRIKGYTAEEIVGQPYGVMFTPEDRAAGEPTRLLAEARRLGSIHGEGWRVRKDGTRFWASVVLSVLRDAEGRMRGYAKVTHDDTTRHEAAEALRLSEERFALAIDALREHAFYMLDLRGMVESWNSGAAKIKGYAASEIVGRHFSVFFTEDDRISGKPQRELELATRLGAFEEEGWRVRKDGTRFWASVVVTAIRDGQGALRGFAKVTRDETVKHQAHLELQRALERARQAEETLRGHAFELESRVRERTVRLSEQAEMLKRTNAELEQFAYIASHDLKEPLRMIASYTDLLHVRYAGLFDQRAKSYFDKITASTRRMSELVESVLDYSRVVDGIAADETVAMGEVVGKVIEDLQQAIAESGARIECAPLPTVRGNSVHLARVFQNLVGNALKFHSERPVHVRIGVAEEGKDWVFSVADNGIGIDARCQDKLFRIFQRLHPAEAFVGTGIGLASCKKIVEHHGGRIWVESELGAGATFRFTLPR